MIAHAISASVIATTLMLAGCAPRPYTLRETAAEWERTQGANVREQRQQAVEAIRALPPSERWRVTCAAPDMTRGTVACSMVSPPIAAYLRDNLTVRYVRDTRGAISGPFIHTHRIHNCPGYAMVVRVDQNAPVMVDYPSTAASLSAQSRAVRLMAQGSIARLAQHEWPNCMEKRSEFSLEGFGDAHRRLLAQVRATRAR